MGAENKILSIVIPYYNLKKYLDELLDCLAPQITDDIEVIVVDDGSEETYKTNYKWVKIIRQKNSGVSSARNKGIENAVGEYIAFIDSDDLVSDKYIPSILDKIKMEKFDYLNLSWKSNPEGIEVILKSIEDDFPYYNRSVWNRVFKRSIIGNTRFNTNKSFGEDAEFIKTVIKPNMKKSYITDVMYYYNTNVPDSLTKKFHNGTLKTRRVVYYFPKVSKQMTFLIDEFRELNKIAEVVLMTNTNQLPQLEDYALVTKPMRIRGTELRGYSTSLFTKIVAPIKADIIIWTEKTYEIGGIETFNYNFCKQLSKYYDIVVLYSVIDLRQKARLSKYARVIKNEPNLKFDCDTLMVNRITDKEPSNVIYNQKVQMVHSCKWAVNLQTPKDNDYLVAVSEAVAKSYPDFKEDYKVIHNVTNPQKVERALTIVSATRTGTNEKGQKRMIALSNLLKRKNIPFIWYCFSDNPIQGAENICFIKPTLNIAPYIKSADYLAQLSDHEGFCYSIVEAMELGVPILVTDLAVLPELGFEDGKTGYKIPWEITDDFDVEKIYEHQLKGTFEYKFDNEKRVKQWKAIFGKGHPVKTICADDEPMIKVKALLTFDDAITLERVNRGDVIERNVSRAYELMQKKFVELVI